ncbi:uncharacterized protein LOC132931648 isoform X1 [Rhopalosiphum padi]|uniref:uncharacterized protein LOC132931648 isoform X1 n=1 Tax=Rhopalosiphum padi TaxID=40932 RepID=UPI00298EAC87|nr:uncharacterized protein LOC132931648 isoform X1 [Rhopalosiphum padi]
MFCATAAAAAGDLLLLRTRRRRCCHRVSDLTPACQVARSFPDDPAERAKKTFRNDGYVRRLAAAAAAATAHNFAGARVGSVGRLRSRRDINAQSTELSILRKT